MKKILIIATGGTIASVEVGSGLAPSFTGEDLIKQVPQLDSLCELHFTQPMNIDSTNMRPAEWMCIRDQIVGAYDAYDGFVVLHGTDTLAYTAAALSYLIQHSPKPIVLTGSQLPMLNPFTDAKLNVYHSLLYALDNHSCDVSVVFGGLVIAGTRARKQRTISFNAFTSVNYPPLAYIRSNRIVRAGLPLSCGYSGEPHLFEHLNARVLVLKLTPGMNPAMFAALMPFYDALIIESFGIGCIPAYSHYQQAIFDWVDAGKTVVVTTQVPEEGSDLSVYKAARVYAEHEGILKGGDMATEAIVAKTMWACGQSSDPKQVRHLFYRIINHDRSRKNVTA